MINGLTYFGGGRNGFSQKEWGTVAKAQEGLAFCVEEAQIVYSSQFDVFCFIWALMACEKLFIFDTNGLTYFDERRNG